MMSQRTIPNATVAFCVNYGGGSIENIDILIWEANLEQKVRIAEVSIFHYWFTL